MTGEDGLAAPVALNPSQRVILRHVEHGLTNDQIGKAMFLSAQTVKTHLRTANRALGTSNRLDAAVAARGAGLL